MVSQGNIKVQVDIPKVQTDRVFDASTKPSTNDLQPWLQSRNINIEQRFRSLGGVDGQNQSENLIDFSSPFSSSVIIGNKQSQVIPDCPNDFYDISPRRSQAKLSSGQSTHLQSHALNSATIETKFESRLPEASVGHLALKQNGKIQVRVFDGDLCQTREEALAKFKRRQQVGFVGNSLKDAFFAKRQQTLYKTEGVVSKARGTERNSPNGGLVNITSPSQQQKKSVIDNSAIQTSQISRNTVLEGNTQAQKRNIGRQRRLDKLYNSIDLKPEPLDSFIFSPRSPCKKLQNIPQSPAQKLKQDQQFYQMTHTSGSKKFHLKQNIDLRSLTSSPAHVQQVVSLSNDKPIAAIKTVQDNRTKIQQDQTKMRSIQNQLFIESQVKSDEATAAAREVIRRMVASAESELRATTEELSWIQYDLEKQAKRNLVEKEMKVARKMEQRKTRQTMKWREKFEKCMQDQKYWRYTKDKQYAAIWPTKKELHTGQSSPEQSTGEQVASDEVQLLPNLQVDENSVIIGEGLAALPKQVIPTHGDHTTLPTSLTGYTNAENKLNSSRQQTSQNVRGGKEIIDNDQGNKLDAVYENRRASQPTKNDLMITTGNFRIGTQVPLKQRQNTIQKEQQSNSPFRSSTFKSKKTSQIESPKITAQSIESKESWRSQSRSPTVSHQTKNSKFQKFCEKNKLTKTQREDLQKTFDLQRYLTYKRSMRNSQREATKILENGVPVDVNQQPDDSEDQPPKRESLPKRGKPKHSPAQSKLFNKIARSLNQNINSNDKGLPILSASLSITSKNSNRELSRAMANNSMSPSVKLATEEGNQLIYRQESIRKLCSNDSRRYEESMRKFDEERREYANKVHHLLVKKGGKAKRKQKHHSKVEVRLESNKANLKIDEE